MVVGEMKLNARVDENIDGRKPHLYGQKMTPFLRRNHLFHDKND